MSHRERAERAETMQDVTWKLIVEDPERAVQVVRRNLTDAYVALEAAKTMLDAPGTPLELEKKAALCEAELRVKDTRADLMNFDNQDRYWFAMAIIVVSWRGERADGQATDVDVALGATPGTGSCTRS